MDSAEQARRWRQKAEECRTVAEQMQNPMVKESFLHMARSYDALAERLERHSEPGLKAPDAG